MLSLFRKKNPLSKLLRIWDFLICIFKTTTARFYSGYNIRSCRFLLSCILFYLNQGSNNSFAKEAGMKAHCYHQLVIWVQLVVRGHQQIGKTLLSFKNCHQSIIILWMSAKKCLSQACQSNNLSRTSVHNKSGTCKIESPIEQHSCLHQILRIASHCHSTLYVPSNVLEIV